MSPAVRAVWVRMLRERPLRWILLPICALQLTAIGAAMVIAPARPPTLEALQVAVTIAGMLPFFVGVIFRERIDEAREILLPGGVRAACIAILQLFALVALVPGTLLAQTVGLDTVAAGLVLLAVTSAGAWFACVFFDTILSQRVTRILIAVGLGFGGFDLIVGAGPTALHVTLFAPLYAQPAWSYPQRLVSDALLVALAALCVAGLRARILRVLRGEAPLIGQVGAVVPSLPRRARLRQSHPVRAPWRQLLHCASALPGRLGDGTLLFVMALQAGAGAAMGWCLEHGYFMSVGSGVPAFAAEALWVQWLVQSDLFQAAGAIRADALRPWTRSRFAGVLLGALLWTSLGELAMIGAPALLMLACWEPPQWSWLPWIAAALAAQPMMAAVQSWQMSLSSRPGTRVALLAHVPVMVVGVMCVCIVGLVPGVQTAVIAHIVLVDAGLAVIGVACLHAMYRRWMRIDLA